MKQFILLSAITTLLLSNSDCSTRPKTGGRYKGKLEVAGICMNYTIRITEGNIDKYAVVANWTDEITNKSYSNVFRLGNPCNFPPSIKQGDEFYFSIDTVKGKDCIVCLAYYPTPTKVLSINVVQ